MARTRSIASIESEIQKTEAELSALSKKYDETAERLKDLQKQKQDARLLNKVVFICISKKLNPLAQV